MSALTLLLAAVLANAWYHDALSADDLNLLAAKLEKAAARWVPSKGRVVKHESVPKVVDIQIQYAISGNCMLLMTTAEGKTTVEGTNDHYSFAAHRLPGDSEYKTLAIVLESFSNRTSDLAKALETEVLAHAQSGRRVMGKHLSELLRDPSVKSAGERLRANLSKITLTGATPADQKRGRPAVPFEALVEIEDDSRVLTSSVTYQGTIGGSKVRFGQIHRYTYATDESDGKLLARHEKGWSTQFPDEPVETRTEYVEIKVGPVDPSEFYLSAFGLPEPHGVTWPKPTPYWLYGTLGSIAVIVLGILLMRWAQRRAAKAAA